MHFHTYFLSYSGCYIEMYILIYPKGIQLCNVSKSNRFASCIKIVINVVCYYTHMWGILHIKYVLYTIIYKKNISLDVSGYFSSYQQQALLDAGCKNMKSSFFIQLLSASFFLEIQLTEKKMKNAFSSFHFCRHGCWWNVSFIHFIIFIFFCQGCSSGKFIFLYLFPRSLPPRLHLDFS